MKTLSIPKRIEVKTDYYHFVFRDGFCQTYTHYGKSAVIHVVRQDDFGRFLYTLEVEGRYYAYESIIDTIEYWLRKL